MTNWKEYRLGELLGTKGYIRGPFGSALRRPEMKSEGYAVYEQQHAIYNTRDFRYFIDENKFAELNRFSIRANDLIISCSGTVGEVSIINEDDPQGIISQALLTLRPNLDLVKPQFLYYFFKTRNGHNQLLSASHGSVQVNIAKREVVESIPVSIPDIETQDSIIEILSSLDDKIELNNKIKKELENLAQTLFKQWFIDFEFPNENGEPYKSSGGEMVESELGEIPKGWEVGVLEDLIDFANGNAFKSKELLKEDIGDCYHVFKMGHIKKGGGLNADGTKSYYEKSKAKKLNKYVLRVGDLLMCMTDMKGNVALLGHTALMNENDKYIVNQRVGLLRPNNDLGIDFPYLYILTNSNDFIEDLRSRANSGVQVNLSTSEIKVSKVLLPPKAINVAFDNCVKAFFESIFNNTKENQELTNLRDTLLPKLISGELEVAEVMAEKA